MRFTNNPYEEFIFRRNRVVDAGCAGAIRATGRQTAVEQVRPTAQRVLKNLVTFPLFLCFPLAKRMFPPCEPYVLRCGTVCFS